MRWPLVAVRIVLRVSVAVWRNRIGLIAAAAILAAFSAYEFTFAGPSVAAADCADTAMTAITKVNESSWRAAYACMGPSMRTTTEDQFVEAMRLRSTTPTQANRVADRHTPDGGKIVFFTVSGTDLPSVGYIIYLDAAGLVTKVE